LDVKLPPARRRVQTIDDESYHEDQDPASCHNDDDDFVYRPSTKIRRPHTANLTRPSAATSQPQRAYSPIDGVKHSPPPEEDSEDELAHALTSQTPRTRHLLSIINTKDVSQIKLLKGVGAKKAESIVNCLCDLEDEAKVTSLGQLGKLKGVGVKTVENMRSGVVV
jgi:DNA uptake protein ComE-like DNA-binding protein